MGNASWHELGNVFLCVPENFIGSDTTLERDSVSQT